MLGRATPPSDQRGAHEQRAEGDESVEVWLTAKGVEKSAVQVQHRKLPDRDAVVRTRARWAERLDALAKTPTS